MQPLRQFGMMVSPKETGDLANMEDESLSPGFETHVKRRNRISFVCQACRRSKTKCDREKPRCGRCQQHGLQCIYDVEKQAAPKNPSKDATIARLQKDVAYWREKALREDGEQSEFGHLNKRAQDGEYIPFEGHDTKKSRRGIGFDSNDIEINLYRTHPSMIMNRVMKREVKPLSENYAVTQDTFLSGLIAAVFLNPSKNTMIPALSANASVSRAQPSVRNNVFQLKEILISQCHNESQKERINDFTDRLLQNTSNSGKLRIGMLPIAIRSAFDRNYLEDFCPTDGEYSDLLKSFISEIEEILPPMEILNKYKAHFYENVYLNLAFLNRKLFEETLSSVLFPDELDPSKVRIKLGKSRLRGKMENLSILLVILKLSFISLLFIDEGSEEHSAYINREVLKRYPIGNEAILLAERVLSAENLFACANENIITCLLYIWSFFVYSPEEGDFFLEHPTDVLTGVIVMLATSIGLHRDPSDFLRLAEVEDSSVLNHRRVLWVAITTTVCIESSLKGRHPLSVGSAMDQFMDIRHPNALEVYMERVKRDIIEPDEATLKLHEMCFKRSLLAVHFYDLDKLSLTYGGTFRLNEMEDIREKIESFVSDNFQLIDLQKRLSSNAKLKIDNSISFNMCGAENSVALHSLIMSRLMLLRASMALFFHFESVLPEKPQLLPFYQKYMIRVCLDSLTLISHITKYFNDEYAANLLPSNSYNITKATQIALSSTFFGVLGVIMRIELAGNTLFSQYQEDLTKNDDENLGSANKKMELLTVLKMDLEAALENIYRVSSKYLRFTYFSVFKMLALFDVVIQRMKKGELWNLLLRLQHVGEMNCRSVKALSMTLALDMTGKESVISQLRKKNHLINISVEDLEALCREVKSVLQGDECMKQKDDPLNSTSDFSNASPTNSNSMMGNLEKLSSAAAMSQNLEFQSSVKGASDFATMNNLQQPSGNCTEANGKLGIDFDFGTGVSMDFPNLFGGLDLFDYDFLFSNDA